MTERLYYTDAYRTRFDANVVETIAHEGRKAVRLDRTAFYPTSGGQPNDFGDLGGAQILDVVDSDAGILHVVDRDVPAGPVEGEIDWTRRFDHMQQHTGQHVLSAAFDTLLQARTVSFHLGAESSTIDLSREVTPSEIARAEREANRIVWEDRPVHVRFVDEAEAARLPLRKDPARGGTLRIVEVEGFDLSACGGTHVARTGAIGTIAVSGWERFKGASRVSFLCGGRALAGYHALRDSVSSSIRLLSVLPSELPAAIERLQAESKDARRQIRALQGQLAGFEADRLAASAESAGQDRLVVTALDGWDANGLKAIASAVAARPRHVAILFSQPSPANVVIARGEGSEVDCAALLKSLTGRFGGKGGGRPELAQGGGLQAPAADLIAAARAAVAG